MCLTTVGRVVERAPATDTALVDLGDRVQQVVLTPVTATGEVVTAGDWLIVQFGLAVRRVDEPTARWLRAGRESAAATAPRLGSVSGGTDAN